AASPRRSSALLPGRPRCPAKRLPGRLGSPDVRAPLLHSSAPPRPPPRAAHAPVPRSAPSPRGRRPPWPPPRRRSLPGGVRLLGPGRGHVEVPGGAAAPRRERVRPRGRRGPAPGLRAGRAPGGRGPGPGVLAGPAHAAVPAGGPPRPGEGGARPGAVRRGLRGLALRAPRRAAWHLREAGRLAAVAHGVPERRRAAAPGGGRAAVVPVGRSEGLHGGAGDAVGPARSEASPRGRALRERPIGGGDGRSAAAASAWRAAAARHGGARCCGGSPRAQMTAAGAP
ncbi:unnamed protein product, partial [Prorocentrum cordatum]